MKTVLTRRFPRSTRAHGDDDEPHTTSDNAASPVIATPVEERAAACSDQDIRLESCADLDWIVVRTRHSVYDVIVLSGETGDVTVRGGEFFPEFHRATVEGSILGARGVTLRSICVGLHLELRVGGKSFVTSRVCAVSRHRLQTLEGRA